MYVDLLLPTCGTHLVDNFEWDLSNPDNSPRFFATIMLKDLSLDSPDNILALEMHIRQQIDAYCAKSCLALRQNIDAIVQEDVEDDVSSSDGGCPLADISQIAAPKKKRDWKAMSKHLLTRICSSDQVDPSDAFTMSGLILRSERFKPSSRVRAPDLSETKRAIAEEECAVGASAGSSFTSQQ